MALIGLSIILASVVYVFVRPPQWQWLHTWPIFKSILATTTTSTIADSSPSSSSTSRRARDPSKADSHDEKHHAQQQQNDKPSSPTAPASAPQTTRPPAPPPLMVLPPTISEPTENEDEDEEATTPTAPSAPPPSLMAPPPRPTVAQFPVANSAQRARGPLPNRSPYAPSSSSLLPGTNPNAGAGFSLAPPPTHSSKPEKPSRKVVLTPGHSPLDWARISGPTCDLRGVPAATPYLRVTPSMLKNQTGRKGKDAWMALSGRVYNVTPYAEFHPGGVPELMRGAGRDATKLFGEIHPWVNYETMLSACLVGLLVDEPEANQESEMDKMD